MKASDLTVNQRATLVRIVGRSARGAIFVGAKETGAPAAAERLAHKGLLDRSEGTGPRGGKLVNYKPNAEGVRLADYITINGLRTW